MEELELPLEIIECICAWYDLLGFGQPLMDSKWNLNDERCKGQLERITKLDLSYTNKYSGAHGTVNLSMNDGIISTFDIKSDTSYFQNQLVMVLDDLVNEYESLNQRDVREGFPGMRGILTFGHRYNYTHVATTYAVVDEKTIAYHPTEFQMNTAFSKAYLMESAGSKFGIAGNNLYIDKYMLDSISSLILSKNTGNQLFKIESDLDANSENKYYSIFRDSDMLLKLEFHKDYVDFNQRGIETTLYKFIHRFSRQDELAHEAQFKRAQWYSQMENDEFNNQ